MLPVVPSDVATTSLKAALGPILSTDPGITVQGPISEVAEKALNAPKVIPQDLDKRFTRGYLGRLLEVLGPVPLDGLLEQPLEVMIELLIYQAGILLLNSVENQNPAFFVQWMEVLKNKNWKNGMTNFFEVAKELPPTLKSLLEAIIKKEKCHSLPLKEFVEPPREPKPLLTLRHLAGLQHSILKIVEPLAKEIKQRLNKDAEWIKKANKSLRIDLAFSMLSQFKMFFRHNQVRMLEIKKEGLPLLDVKEDDPLCYQIVHYFVGRLEHQLGEMRVTTQSGESQAQKVLDDLGTLMVPPLRTEGARKRIIAWVRAQEECTKHFVERLSTLFKDNPGAPCHFKNYSQVIRSTFRFLQQSAQDKLDGTFAKKRDERSTQLEKVAGLAWANHLKSFLSEIEKCVEAYDADFHKKKCENDSHYIFPRENSPRPLLLSAFYERLVQFTEVFSINPFWLRIEISPGIFISIFLDKYKERIHRPVESIEVEIDKLLKAEGEENPSLKKNYDYLYDRFTNLHESYVQYRSLLDAVAFVMPGMKALQSPLLKKAQMQEQQACLWIRAEAESHEEELKAAQLASLSQVSKKTPVASKRVEVEVREKKEKEKKPPAPLLREGLFFARDAWIPNHPAPADMIGKKDIDRIEAMKFDAGFHATYVGWIVDLMQKPAARKFFPLLAAELLHQTYLAEEQIGSASFYAQHPESVLKHSLKTFWWRYLYSSLQFHLNNKPEGLSFLYDLHQETGGFTKARTALLKGSITYLFDGVVADDPKLQKHLTQEKDKLLVKLKEIAASTYASVPLLRPFQEIEERLQSKLQTDFLLKPQEFQNAAQDLRPHIKRLSQACQLAKEFRQRAYVGLHAYNILVSLQYIYELIGVMDSFQRNDGMHTHDLRFYAEKGQWSKILGPNKVQKILDLNMKKGGDYPYWTFLNNGGHVPAGLRALNDAYLYSLDETLSGKEFIPFSLEGSVWTKDPCKHLMSLVDEHVPLINALLSNFA